MCMSLRKERNGHLTYTYPGILVWILTLIPFRDVMQHTGFLEITTSGVEVSTYNKVVYMVVLNYDTFKRVKKFLGVVPPGRTRRW